MKNAIVLGGSAGVGHAIVEKLVSRGFRVGVVARGDERLDEMRTHFGDSVVTETADVADAGALDQAVERLVAALGAPTVWINSAMATVFSPFVEMSTDEFERVTDVTYLGQVNGSRAALRHMREGQIVFVGSGLAYRPVPGQSAYCGAKHAINGFVGSLRSELLREKAGVTVHLVQLPALNTPQFDWARSRLDSRPQPAPPIYAPSVAADAVMKVLDTGAREVMVGQSVLKLVFSNMVLPDFLDRKLAREGFEAQTSEKTPAEKLDNLHEPAAYDAGAEGSYGDRASTRGVIVDADRLRKGLMAGLLGVPFLVGLALG